MIAVWSEGTAERIKHLQSAMDNSSLDLVVISDPKNVHYFTGYLNESATPIPSYLLVPADQDPILVTGNTETSVAERTYGGRFATYVNYDVNQRMVAYPDLAAGKIEQITGTGIGKARQIGVEFWTLPEAIHRALSRTSRDSEFVDISAMILNMRGTKYRDEIEAIKRGFEMNDLAFGAIRENAAEGRTELDSYAAAYRELTVKKGPTYFKQLYGDFVSGERSVLHTGPPTTRVLKNGDTFIIDLWLATQGYWADSCRTFIIGRDPTAEQRRTIEVLKEALKTGAEKLRPGNTAKDVYTEIFHVVEKAGFAGHFPHHGGHGVGLDAWEPPFIIPSSKEELKEGMVCSLEPGIYLKAVGGMRIENGYLITSDRAESLCKFPLDP